MALVESPVHRPERPKKLPVGFTDDDLTFSPTFNEWMLEFPCDCNNGYRGSAGISCHYCEGHTTVLLTVDDVFELQRRGQRRA